MTNPAIRTGLGSNIEPIVTYPIVISTNMRRDGPSGLQTHARMFSAFLEEHQHECTLLTPFNAPTWQVYPIFGMRRVIEPLNTSAGTWWHMHWHQHFLKRALHRHLHGGEACLVYAQCLVSADAALKARISPTQRVVMAVHFNISEADEWVGKGVISSGGKMYKAIRKLESDVLEKVDGLVFVSDFMCHELLSRFPRAASLPYIVVPNFVSDPGVLPTTAAKADLISIGTLEPRKNQGFLLDIIAAARGLGTELSVTVVGQGSDQVMLENKARTLRIDDLVRFTGFVRNAAQLIPQHRACIHVAKLENLPLTLIEALSSGIPVFAPAVGGIPEIFDDGIEGRILPLNDAHRAAKLILEWLQSPQKMLEAGLAARRRFLLQFDSTVAAARLVTFFNSFTR